MERSWVSSAAYRVIIDQLIAAREGQGVGQRELARRLGKHPSWLNKIERLERRLDLLEFIAIARAIGLSPSEFVARIDGDLPADLQV
ncbi:helix-turn-helix domain-containing protein [Phenylobacterium sp.]|uniref:helix-turn-helix domain-containing protein n=1 Tax=Phenylobacterium sp. TaxID=1871053 RepID=UPI002FC69438